MGFHIHLSDQNTNKKQNIIQLDVHAQPPKAPVLHISHTYLGTTSSKLIMRLRLGSDENKWASKHSFTRFPSSTPKPIFTVLIMSKCSL